MKSKRIQIMFAMLLLIQSLWLVGCAAIQTFDDRTINNRYRRFYSGEPLPRNQIAIFLSGQTCFLNTLDDGKEVKRIYNLSYIQDGELLPGHYILCIRLDPGKVGGLASVGCVNQALQALPGHVYYINYSISSDGKSWHPIVQDLGVGNYQDFEKINVDDATVKGRGWSYDDDTKRTVESWKRYARYRLDMVMRGPDWRKPIIQNKNGYLE